MTAAGITTAATTSSANFADYVVRELRCAELRARIEANELRFMGIAVDGGFIDPGDALQHLADVGALPLVIPSSEVFHEQI
jgi:hypothetical protein